MALIISDGIESNITQMCVHSSGMGKNVESLEPTIDMPCGVGDKRDMKRPLFNLMIPYYAATVLSVLVSDKKDCEGWLGLALVCKNYGCDDEDADNDEGRGSDDNN